MKLAVTWFGSTPSGRSNSRLNSRQLDRPEIRSTCFAWTINFRSIVLTTRSSGWNSSPMSTVTRNCLGDIMSVVEMSRLASVASFASDASAVSEIIIPAAVVAVVADVVAALVVASAAVVVVAAFVVASVVVDVVVTSVVVVAVGVVDVSKMCTLPWCIGFIRTVGRSASTCSTPSLLSVLLNIAGSMLLGRSTCRLNSQLTLLLSPVHNI